MIPLPATTAPCPVRASVTLARNPSPSSEVRTGPTLSASLKNIFVVGATRTGTPASPSSPAVWRIALDFPPAPTKATMSPLAIPKAL